MNDSYRLSDLPAFAKLFVALFTSLMLCVCFWAGWLYTVEKGEIDEDNLPAYLQIDSENPGRTSEQESGEEHEDEHAVLRHNLGLAHTHINGQTLLFFAVGLVFLFTSVSPGRKKTVYWVFGLSVFAHAVGLSGEGYHWSFDDLLAVSGVAILAAIIYMAFSIFVDLARRGPASERSR